MSWAIIWIALAVIFAIIEAVTFGLATIWFAAGALIALIFVWLGAGVYVQIAAFLISSALMLILTRPLVTKYMHVGSVKTNVDSLVGKKGMVVSKITEHNYGQVKLSGQVWTAKSTNAQDIQVDTEVVVNAIEGVKLVVSQTK